MERMRDGKCRATLQGTCENTENLNIEGNEENKKGCEDKRKRSVFGRLRNIWKGGRIERHKERRTLPGGKDTNRRNEEGYVKEKDIERRRRFNSINGSNFKIGECREEKKGAVKTRKKERKKRKKGREKERGMRTRRKDRKRRRRRKLEGYRIKRGLEMNLENLV